MAETRIAQWTGRVVSGNLTTKVSLALYSDPDNQEMPLYIRPINIYVYSTVKSEVDKVRMRAFIYVGGITYPQPTTSTEAATGSGTYYYRFLGTDTLCRTNMPVSALPSEEITFNANVLVNGSAAGFIYGPLIYPKTIHLTPPQTVQTDALNLFTCDTPFTIPNNVRVQASCSGRLRPSLISTDCYYDATTLLKNKKETAISQFYWYPNHNRKGANDFVNGVGEYELQLVIKQPNDYFSDMPLYIFEGGSGAIYYNETPPQAAAPALSLSSLEVAGAGILAQYGKYIKGKSRVQFSAAYTLKYGAALSSFSLAVGSATVSTTTATISPTVDGSAVATILDNFGLSTQQSIAYQVYDYWDPEMTQIAVHRCKQDGTRDDTGAYVLIEWAINIAPLGNQNSKSLTITHPGGTTTPTLSSYNQSGSLIAPANTELSYTITFALTDDFTTVTRTVPLSTAAVTMDIYKGGRGIAFGKVAEHDHTFEISDGLTVLLNTQDSHQIDLVDALVKLATAAHINIYVDTNSGS